MASYHDDDSFNATGIESSDPPSAGDAGGGVVNTSSTEITVSLESFSASWLSAGVLTDGELDVDADASLGGESRVSLPCASVSLLLS